MTHEPAYRSSSYRAYLCPDIEGVIEPESTELYITVQVCVHCGAIVVDQWQHNRWHKRLLPPPKAKPRKRTPQPPPDPAPLRPKKTAPDDQIRCARVRDEVRATGPNTPPAQLAQRLHMDVWEVRQHLRTLGYNAKPPQ